ncbi:MAG: peroxiredoxin [Opitutae bacterium]|jgi:thioredoxin-dependent peroxiredoxin|nr:peroxiredoxin [Opitutae bacterium]MBT5910158.1 peroxiredoxin [Opitutae bacterium]MBT6851236.1 peroxiredoxin [Opitutae bacterium]MBT7740892.1 peroxiredoxin [Opitutae bacterium]MBT7925216.1 peroxiredoxin [Opitutae bacterium]
MKRALAYFTLIGLSSFSPMFAAKVLNVGDKAPVFTTLDDKGKQWKSGDIVGSKHLVVYFYPAAMTGGCTKQACAFRDDKSKLTKLDAVVVGVSGDNPEGLAHFKKAENLNFTLLSDEKGDLAQKFGVPFGKGGVIERKVDEKKVSLSRGVTSKRWTFVISKDGKVVYKNDKVNAAKDSEAVCSVLAKL